MVAPVASQVTPAASSTSTANMRRAFFMVLSLV
jgi:hypothetical protein